MISSPKVGSSSTNILASMAQNRFFVGEAPGQAQGMKLLNNFLSATAMTATSEAIAFGARLGLNPRIMIDVLNSSSGQNTATRDKFPQRILTETYDAGFTIDLLNKDVELYLDEASRAGSGHTVAKTVGQVVSRIQEAMPGADFTKIYPLSFIFFQIHPLSPTFIHYPIYIFFIFIPYDCALSLIFSPFIP